MPETADPPAPGVPGAGTPGAFGLPVEVFGPLPPPFPPVEPDEDDELEELDELDPHVVDELELDEELPPVVVVVVVSSVVVVVSVPPGRVMIEVLASFSAVSAAVLALVIYSVMRVI